MKRILVIEDEPDVRESIVDMLSAEDFFVMSAKDGQDGLQMVNEFKPNLILCDVMMPNLDGYGVLTQLRMQQQTETIPFVFLTAKADKSDFRVGMDLGADDYLTKPFTYAELFHVITTRLGKQDAIAQQSQQKLDELRQSINLALPQELNAPLSGILNTASLLMEESTSLTPEEILEMAEAIYQNGKRLQRLTHNFLLLSRLEMLDQNSEQAKAMRTQHTSNTDAVINEVLIRKAEEYQRMADLQVEIKQSPVQMSESKFRKVVEELVDNALKFSKPGSPIKVHSSCDEHHFALYIIDYGQGMTLDQITNVGAFVQFDRDLQDQQGLGLGLTIAKRLIELHKGELSIESVPGQQTIIRVVIPRES